MKLSVTLKKTLFTYRFDLLSLGVFSLILFWFTSPLLSKGMIVFSDLDFPLNSKRYLEGIFGLWNERWNTGTLFNLPRLMYILPSWILSALSGFSGPVFIKAFLLQLLFTSGISMYLLTKRIVSVTLGSEFTFFRTITLVGASLFYAFNPWVLIRIQHIYLLCGYSLFPLVLYFFLNAFDPRYTVQFVESYSAYRIKPYRYIVLNIAACGLTIAIMSAAIHYFFFSILFLLMFSMLLLAKILWDYRRAGSRRLNAIVASFCVKGVLLASFTLIFSLYWFGPYVGSILTNAQPSQHNINVIDTLMLFSRNSSMLNNGLLISYWWPMFPYESLGRFFYAGAIVSLLVVAAGFLFWAGRNRLVLFFGVLTILLFFIASGTKLNFFAPTFIRLVMDTPVFGTIFRDPNKLLGLSALGYSIMFTFALLIFDTGFSGGSTIRTLVQFLLLGVIALCFWFYVRPFHERFINGFYRPVAIPQEYKEILQESQGMAIQLPLAESMLRNPSWVSTPTWNLLRGGSPDKATGDFAQYSSLQNGFFHHEGNPLEVGAFYRYITALWDRGLIRNSGELLSLFGADELVYRKEFSEHEKRQKFHLDLLKIQHDLSLKSENAIFSRFDLAPDKPKVLSNAFFSSSGLSLLPSLSMADFFSFQNTGVFFLNQQLNQQLLENIQEDDVVQLTNFDDIWLSSMPNEYYAVPTDSVRTGNPFISWAQNATLSEDWAWHLRSQGLSTLGMELDFRKGIVFSYASATLNVPPYQRDLLKGKKILDFNSMLQLDLFFVADNPELVSIEPVPLQVKDIPPVLKGQIIRGDPKAIWQIAKSGIIPAKENTPYEFTLRVTGRGSHKLHAKVRFFDDSDNELAVNYVVGPGELINFDEIHFKGEYVSPPDTHSMRIDLLSLQRPVQTVYWWIHDINIMELSDYSTENSFTLKAPPSADGHSGELFLRVFSSPKGGYLGIKAGGIYSRIATGGDLPQGFHWISAGSFSLAAGEEMTIFHEGGFNAVNLLAYVPNSKRAEMMAPAQRLIDKARIVYLFEAEKDFSLDTHLQSTRVYPDTSSGNIIRGRAGKLKRMLDIPHSGRYTLKFTGGGEQDTTGLQVLIHNQNAELVFDQSFRWKQQKPQQSLTVKTHTLDAFSRELSFEESDLSNYQTREMNNIELSRGRYTIEIEYISENPSLIPLQSFDYFDPRDIISIGVVENLLPIDCSDCEKIVPEMLQHGLVRDNPLKISMDATDSCDWYISSSEPIPIEEKREYLFRYRARSEYLKQRHAKILFLDKDKKILDVDYIQEVDENKKQYWQNYEQIALAPENTETMLLQFWSRGTQGNNGALYLANLDVVPLYREPYLDVLSGWNSEKPPVSRLNSHSGYIHVAGIPSLPIWHGLESGANRYAINGLLAAFFSDSPEAQKIFLPLQKVYLTGLVIFVVSLISLFCFWCIRFVPQPRLTRLRITELKKFFGHF